MCWKALFLSLLIAASGDPASGQVVTNLRVEKQIRVPESVHSVVAIGGPRDTIKCDERKNLWIPALRGYSETVSAVVRYTPAQGMIKFDIDEWPTIANGSIEYFYPSPDGGALVLIRSVIQYSDGDSRPVKYGDTFAVKFSSDGKPSKIQKLLHNDFLLQPSGLAELKEGWLLIGWGWVDRAIRIRALLFDSGGKFKSEVDLPGNTVKPTNTQSAPTQFVFTPSLIAAADGSALVLRGFTDQPIYRISGEGKLVASIKLKPDGVVFWSPRVVGNRLFVQAEVKPVRTGNLGNIPIVHGRSAFALFSLESGEITEVMTLDGHDTGAVGCYDDEGPQLTFVDQEFDRETFWVIQTVRPVPPPSRSKTN